MELFTFSPFFAAGAAQFALEKATTEGKITIGLLGVLSLFSWTVIITKGRQLWRARRMSRKFLAAYRATRDPMDLFRAKQEFDGAPVYEVYSTAMAPGVAGALIATVVGLLVAIPAMFAYNFMVTQVRGLTQELDDYAGELATQVEHLLVEHSATDGATGATVTGAVTLALESESPGELKTSPHTTHLARGGLTG